MTFLFWTNLKRLASWNQRLNFILRRILHSRIIDFLTLFIGVYEKLIISQNNLKLSPTRFVQITRISPLIIGTYIGNVPWGNGIISQFQSHFSLTTKNWLRAICLLIARKGAFINFLIFKWKRFSWRKWDFKFLLYIF